MKAPIQRGTNISHWLSQCEGRSGERQAWFTQYDVRRIADWTSITSGCRLMKQKRG